MPHLKRILTRGSKAACRAVLLERVDRITCHALPESLSPETWLAALSTARFSPSLPVVLADSGPNGKRSDAERELPTCAPYAAAVHAVVLDQVGELPLNTELEVMLEVGGGGPRFIAAVVSKISPTNQVTPSGLSGEKPSVPAPVGQPAASVTRWFDGLTTITIPEHDGTLPTARKGADAYAQAARAPNTIRSYRAAVRAWCRWAAGHDLPALPARSHDLKAYFADMAMKKRALTTIELHRAALRYLHHLAGVTIPTTHASVTTTIAGIRRTAEHPLPRAKTALTWDRLVTVLDAIEADTLRGARDRAILLLGFAGAFRRSELAALQVSDVTIDGDGMRIRLGQSKGDTRRQGVLIGIPKGITENCPVLAYERWIRLAAITDGVIFRRIRVPAKARPGQPPPLPRIGNSALSDRTIAEVVRSRCGAVGLDGDFAGHSLRRGAITAGAADGFDLLELKRFSRHRSLRMVEAYIDEATIKARNPGKSRF